MQLLAGKPFNTIFQVSLSGSLVNADPGLTCSVFKEGVKTSITPTIQSLETGVYLILFMVPDNWLPYDQITITFNAAVGGVAASGIKTGMVIEESSSIALQQALTLLSNISRCQGLIPGVTATVLDANEERDGFLETSDGVVRKRLHQNGDGSVTISDFVG